MSEKPIIFSAPMVRAILDGRKTQTRRIISLAAQLAPNYQRSFMRWNSKDQWWEFRGLLRDWPIRQGRPKEAYWETFVPPIRYAVGTRLWVKEAHAFDESEDGQELIVYRADGETWSINRPSWDSWNDAVRVEKADWKTDSTRGLCWRSSIHMHRWASRITLEVTSVRVQRVQEISEEDAIAEGVEPYRCPHADALMKAVGGMKPIPYTSGFANLWNEIHGKIAWAANPWVWAYTFRRVNRE